MALREMGFTFMEEDEPLDKDTFYIHPLPPDPSKISMKDLNDITVELRTSTRLPPDMITVDRKVINDNNFNIITEQFHKAIGKHMAAEVDRMVANHIFGIDEIATEVKYAGEYECAFEPIKQEVDTPEEAYDRAMKVVE